VNDETMRAAYRERLADRGSVRDGCVAPEALLAVVDGTASDAERLATLRHVGSCDACRSELELLRTAGDAAREAARDTRTAWPGRQVLAAAAMLIVLAGSVTLWRILGTSGDDPLRSGTQPARLVAPADGASLPRPVTLAWTAFAPDERYTVHVVAPDGSIAFEGATTDTSLVVPPQALESGVDYVWWVHGWPAGGMPVRSPPGPFRITPP